MSQTVAQIRAQKNYLVRHPERRKASLKKYYEAHKATEHARARQWEQDNRERFLARRKQYRRGNPKEIAAVVKWQKKNPEKVRVYNANTRAKRKLVEGTLTVGLAERLLIIQRGRCAACDKKLTTYHLDHIEPLSGVGKNVDGNMQVLCPYCNQSKSARNPIEFMQSLGKLL
jgi:5-methylcytosine-specific restriction endonuclease McrA